MLNAAPKRLVVATANPGKLSEFRCLLAGLPFELTSLAGLRLPSPAETGSSFLANATLKARHAATLSRCAAIADDSGLEVDALGGAPGIYSARYAGPGADDGANNAKLMQELEGVPGEQRRARYQCALVFVAAPDAAPLTAEAAWEGSILEAPRGSGGFGYDPYFWLPELRLSAAELAPEEKNRLSHRGKALRMLRELLLAQLGAGTGELGAGQLGTRELDAGQIGSEELGAAEPSAAELGATELGIGELDTAKVGAAEPGAAARPGVLR